MQALVLVGGRGTRLLPLTETVPKPVLPLVDRPFLVFFLEWLGDHGVDDVVLACGFRPGVMQEVLADWAGDLPSLTWVVEDEPLGTAGAMRHALGHLEDEFLALNGDLLSDFDLGELIRFHREKGARATLGLKEVDDPGPYGLVELGPAGEVLGFSEKPEDPSALPPPPWLVNAGTYVLDRSIIEELPPGEALSIERDVFPRLAGDGMYGLGLEGYWMDIGTPERYLQATWDVLEGRLETSVPVRTDGVLVHDGSEVSPTATVGPRAVVGEGCTVADGADVRGSVLLSGAAIGSKASVADSILGGDAVVSDGELVEGEVRGQAPVVQNRGRDAR